MEKCNEVMWNVMIGGLAESGCGHEAYHLSLQTPRSGFKPFRSKYGPKDKSLEREIQVLEKVHHPNCICFKECFFTSNSVYLITEFVTGGELLDRVLARGKYLENEDARVIHQILMGVAYLHLIGIVHQDLKLENILLKTPDNDSVVKIADFGLSKIFAGAAILSTICGSPPYVAPEVLEIGQKQSSYSPAADLCESALFKKIKKGQYSFIAPVWETITDDAKDLVCGLLCVIPDQRLTAAGALAHPWIQFKVDGSLLGLTLEFFGVIVNGETLCSDFCKGSFSIPM